MIWPSMHVTHLLDRLIWPGMQVTHLLDVYLARQGVPRHGDAQLHPLTAHRGEDLPQLGSRRGSLGGPTASAVLELIQGLAHRVGEGDT